MSDILREPRYAATQSDLLRGVDHVTATISRNVLDQDVQDLMSSSNGNYHNMTSVVSSSSSIPSSPSSSSFRSAEDHMPPDIHFDLCRGEHAVGPQILDELEPTLNVRSCFPRLEFHH